MILILIQNSLRFNRIEYVGSACVVILLFLPLVTVLKEESKLWRRKEHPINDPLQVKVVVENPQILEEPVLPPIEAQASESQIVASATYSSPQIEVKTTQYYKHYPASTR